MAATKRRAPEREISGLRKRVAVEGVQKDNGDAPPIADANNEDQATQPAETGPKREKKSLQPNPVELFALNMLTPSLGKNHAKMTIRSVSATVMFIFLYKVVCYGHLPMAGLFIFFNVVLFWELVNVRYTKAKEAQVPLFRTIQWAWFVVALFYAYGSSFLKAPMGLKENLKPFRIPVFGTVSRLHQWLSFGGYAVVFVCTVLNLKRGLYRYQIKQMAWTLLTLLLTVVQLKCVVFNIAQGLFWVIFPMVLVIVNDTMAYFCGKAAQKRIFGRKTVFMELSPNKTWDGFVGGGICTMIVGFYLPAFLSQYNHLTCSYEQYTFGDFADTLCADLPDSPFRQQENLWDTGLNVAPAQFHGVALAFFASLVAPFGGFFASAIKRAHKLDDFGNFIPGHGGFMDRLDCQFLMTLYTNVHYNVFIATPVATVMSAIRDLTVEQQQELLAKLKTMISVRTAEGSA